MSDTRIDMRCHCSPCEIRTQETYELGCSCSNCGWKGTALIRKGDKPNYSADCPHCGVSYRLSFGISINLDEARQEKRARAKA